MANSRTTVEATIAAQNTFSDALTFPSVGGLQAFRVEVKGSSTFTGSSVVTIQGKAEDDADAEYFDLGEIAAADAQHCLVGEIAGGLHVRAGCKTGEFQASDSIKIRLTRV